MERTRLREKKIKLINIETKKETQKKNYLIPFFVSFYFVICINNNNNIKQSKDILGNIEESVRARIWRGDVGRVELIIINNFATKTNYV
jgi:hypothetical protein